MSRINKSEVIARLFFPLAVLYSELFSHFFYFGFELEGFLKITLFSVLLGSLADFLLSFMKEKGFTVSGIVFLALTGFLHSVQLVYYGFFRSFFSWSYTSMAGDLMQFWRETMVAIIKAVPLVLCVFLPLVAFCVFRKKLYKPSAAKRLHVAFVCLVVALFSCVSFIPKENRNTAVYIAGDMQKGFKNYGIVFGSTLDLVGTVFNVGEGEVVNPYESIEVISEEVKKVEYNSLDIDFEYLKSNTQNEKISGMHDYFKSVPPTEKNEYTGMFKGKNLIFLCLEGFSHKAINPDLTPILHKMYTEGFRFENFYSSLWGGSTATGEYAVMTGNFYSKANCIENSAKTNQYYSLGNIFKREGYNTYAYHNHTYTYYERHKSHPNFGYDVFKAVGNGLKFTKGLWPNSDEELALLTADEFLSSEKPFHTYYMTVSGHAFYNWGGNNMSARNRDIIPAEWDYSEGVKAYFACQYEVEKMLAVLMEKLQAAGKLDNTVFAMSCDHYPYALEDRELAELYGIEEKDVRSNFDLYRNAFILWSPSMTEPVVVEKPCSAYDIVPTLANLFGVEYDSRLITGRDILSPGENIVVLNILGNGSSWNWITEKGEYDAHTGVFTPYVNMDYAEKESYVEITKQKVDAMKKYSYGILDNNYYSYVFDEAGEVIKPPLEEASSENVE